MIRICDFTISSDNSPFIIAEMSGNHDGSLDTALQIVDAVAESGANAIKLQTYTADTMTLDVAEKDFFIDDPSSLWCGYSLYDLYQKAHTPWEWHEPIFNRAKKRGLIAFSTPFDESAVDFLESLDVPAYKIASFENIDLDLIKKVSSTGKPVIISTGMASLSEIEEAVKAARSAGCKNLCLLKCTSNYPADPKSSNLVTIPYLKKLFNCQVGISDHTLGIGAAIVSVGLGATVIEKHVTLNRQAGGVDADFSLEPSELGQLVRETRAAHSALGQLHFGITAEEQNSSKFRRTLYICADMQAGDVITKNNLRAIRPGFGLQPKYISYFIGKKIIRDVKKGTPLNWDILMS